MWWQQSEDERPFVISRDYATGGIFHDLHALEGSVSLDGSPASLRE